jgi:hypothetical protein
LQPKKIEGFSPMFSIFHIAVYPMTTHVTLKCRQFGTTKAQKFFSLGINSTPLSNEEAMHMRDRRKPTAVESDQKGE